jgi:hypothetical protein
MSILVFWDLMFVLPGEAELYVFEFITQLAQCGGYEILRTVRIRMTAAGKAPSTSVDGWVPTFETDLLPVLYLCHPDVKGNRFVQNIGTLSTRLRDGIKSQKVVNNIVASGTVFQVKPASIALHQPVRVKMGVYRLTRDCQYSKVSNLLKMVRLIKINGVHAVQCGD